MKLASESFLTSYSLNNKIKSFIFRFPNVVGKNLTHGIIYDFKRKFTENKNVVYVLGNGNQKKPYSLSSEILNCMNFVIQKKHRLLINHYNIGSNDHGIKVKDIVQNFKNSFQKKLLVMKKKRRMAGRYYQI